MKQKVILTNQLTITKLSTNATDGSILIEFVALEEGTWNRVFYGFDQIEKIADQLVGKQLTKNHSDSIDDIVGEVVEAWAEPDQKRVMGKARVDDSSAQDKLEKYKIGQSLELYQEEKYDKENKRVLAEDIETLRASLVLDPACSTCYAKPLAKSHAENATKCESQYMNPERTNYKKGWTGCLEAKQACAGLDEKHAEIMCGYIFRRRGDATPYSIDYAEVSKLHADYLAADDKETFIRALELETKNERGGNMPDEDKLTEEEIKEQEAEAAKAKAEEEAAAKAKAEDDGEDDDEDKKKKPEDNEDDDDDDDDDDDKDKEDKSSDAEVKRLKAELEEFKEPIAKELIETFGVCPDVIKKLSVKEAQKLLETLKEASTGSTAQRRSGMGKSGNATELKTKSGVPIKLVRTE